MSVFNFPRINFKGLMIINVGTANNDDYSSDVFPPGSPYAGQPVRLADSINVQPLTYGKTDADWITWVQEQGTFATAPTQSAAATAAAKTSRSEGSVATAAENTVQLIPGEWNYYGDMGLTMLDVNVTGITDPKSAIPASLSQQLMQSSLNFNNRPDSTGRSTGMLIDCNPEDPTNSQVFTDFLSLQFQNTFLMSGKPSKASTRWINFQRNANLTGPNGAAATFQCAIPLDELTGQPILAGMPTTSPDGRALAGVVCQYSMFRSMQPINTFKYEGQAWFDKIIALYAEKGMNPSYVQLQGTLAPWYEGDMESMPEGRYLIPTSNTVPVPPGCKANGPVLPIAPATLQIDQVNKLISVNLTASFPEKYTGSYDPTQTNDNAKLDFGTVQLGVIYQGVQTNIADIPYTNMANDASGWIFDIPFSTTIPNFTTMITEGNFVLNSTNYNNVLSEIPYLIVSDQSTVYAEQNPSGGTQSTFLLDGPDPVQISFNIYKKGVKLTAADSDSFALWVYDTTPNQDPGTATPLMAGYKAGQPIVLPVGSPGNRLITAVPSSYPPPPSSYANFAMNYAPIINIRILPNDKDYSQYYVDPTAAQPVGNDKLTFEVMYDEVLRNYYLLYPAMSLRVPLNDPQYWDDPEMARRLATRVSMAMWGTAEAMPRTRDLSDSRRTLITAWCLKIIQNGTNPVS
jgi:hypothetical protein